MDIEKKVRTDIVSGADGLCNPDTYLHLSSFQRSGSIKKVD